ncbi:MAG TPA: hypothetical protein V6D05_09430 [Stenomitos sp.]
MRKHCLIAALSVTAAVVAAGPALASPTAIWTVPTGKVTAPGNLHIGVYTFSTPSRQPVLQDGLTFGALPGLELGGVSGIGALEVGIDTFARNEVFNGKLQLFGEGSLWPAVSLGGFNLANTTGPSENILYGVMSKGFELGGVSLGNWTLGYFTTQTSDQTPSKSGLMGGMFYPLGARAGVAVDYLGNTTGFSGTNVYLTYGVAENAYLSVGHYFHPTDREADLTFMGVDMDLATGLFGH